MRRFECPPLLFLMTGLAWLIVASLVGMAGFLGIVRGTPLPTWLRLLHVHGALVGGVAQMILGAMLTFIPTLLMTGQKRSDSHPILYLAINGGTIGLLIGFGLRDNTVIGAAGTLIIFAFLSAAGDAIRQAKASLNSPPLNLWFYGLALVCLFAGLALGAGMAFGLISGWYGHARLSHIHLNLLGFVTLTIIGTMHNLLPTVLQTPLHSLQLARLVFVLWPAGLFVLIGGFSQSSLWVEIAGGGILIVASAAYAYNMFKTWLNAGTQGNAASDHLLVATCFLVLAIIMGVLVGVNSLWNPPALPFGTLHLVAYTHMALVGFVFQTIIGALSHLVPVTLAVRRVASQKKRPSYLDQLTQIVNRWRAVQIGALSLGTMGLAVVASLTWSLPLNALTLQLSAWVSFGLLLFSLTLFAAKVGHLVGKQPAS